MKREGRGREDVVMLLDDADIVMTCALLDDKETHASIQQTRLFLFTITGQTLL